ncbi:Aldo/keto reductase [Lindgomyces ingoldianus]|uniref:Aldo/keto reductase n=1 Tax=Lindgomyces ingoldianus TaxID=673940 RepID=A0ACB6REM1_9PLEO|nr:Aldo/keto reductase [Lindgomyces ingoldianus]KAF2477646.1 Aldo/keto reductase [Lindgomyces ingoldianus]
MSPPKILMGTGLWGDETSKEVVTKLAEVLKELKIKEIDGAALYPITNPGQSEKLIGECGYVENGFLVDSKILHFGGGEGTLSKAAIERSLDQSLANIKTDKLHILYCHGPDKETPIAEQVATLDAEYKKGKFEKLGVCNFPIEMLEQYLKTAEEKGYIKPSVFQGQYNLLCRGYEARLLPLLRKHNISFVAYSPLAGGYLTGKLTFSTGTEDLKETRFNVSDTNYMGMAYRNWYDKPSMHSAVRKMEGLCKAHGVQMSDAACRWVLHHSILDGEHGDGVIIGPRTLAQLAKYAESYKQGPLTDELAKELSDVWEIVKEDAASIVY